MVNTDAKLDMSLDEVIKANKPQKTNKPKKTPTKPEPKNVKKTAPKQTREQPRTSGNRNNNRRDERDSRRGPQYDDRHPRPNYREREYRGDVAYRDRDGNGFARSPPLAPKARLATAQSKPAPGTQILLINIPHDLKETEIAEAFSRVGTVISATVLRDAAGRHTGKATVRYADQASAKKAIASYNGGNLNDNKITVILDQ